MMLRKSSFLRTWLALVLIAVSGAGVFADAYDPPANYYNNATGTGTTLKNQLTAIMSSGHILRSYGDFRYMAGYTDADPNQPGNILLVYNRQSVSATWDGGGTWNREHTWPQSLQSGSASNSTTGPLADPHMLRPVNPNVNSDRSNDPFGLDSTTGSNRSLGSYYYPGDADAGDIARTMFYAATRWAGNGFTLTDTYPGFNQMGDLSSLLRWHYRDTPDDFERRRNQAVYSSALNPYYSNNRNAYVDRPEFVWSVFVDQQNDTRLYLGPSVNSNGSSSVDVDLGRVIKGAASTPTQNVTLHKVGVDGTYYQVTTTGNATSSVTGRYNAFEIDSTGTRNINVGLNANTNVVGIKTGTVVVDNLDVTTQGGAGRGANDANDTANVSLTVLEHANASFTGGGDLNTLTIDFGTVTRHTTAAMDFDLFNYGVNPSLTAGLDFDSISVLGDGGSFALSGGPIAALAAGDSATWGIQLDTDALGTFGVLYTLFFSDEDLPGATGGQQLTLIGTGTVALALPGDANNDGVVDAADYVAAETHLGTIGTDDGTLLGDADDNGRVDGDDYLAIEKHFGNSYADLPTPEPGTAAVLITILVCVGRRRA